jgi:hypothetical protein
LQHKIIYYLRRLIAIFFLLNFLLFTVQINTTKFFAKQFTTSVPAEEESVPNKALEKDELNKLFQQIKSCNTGNDIYYSISKDKTSNQTLHMFPVYWLETFSPPPDWV